MKNTVKKFGAQKIPHTAIFLILALIWSSPATATEISGVKFETRVFDEGVGMELKGTALKKVIFFKAFAAGFYQDIVNNENLLGDTPKRIEVEYFVEIPAYKMQRFTVKSMKENITDAQFNALINKVEEMGRYFVDLKPGDRYSLTYIPGVGTKFAHNGQLAGVIEGKDFQKALFSVWLGEKPFDHQIKKDILGLSNEKTKDQDQLVMGIGGEFNEEL